jgi:hypothetical protein
MFDQNGDFLERSFFIQRTVSFYQAEPMKALVFDKTCILPPAEDLIFLFFLKTDEKHIFLVLCS